MGRRSERDEKLAAVGVRSRIRHRENPGLRVARAGMELVGEVVTRSARPLSERIAALNHETIDDAVKDDAVIEGRLAALAGRRVAPFLGALRQAREIGHRVGRLLVKEADLEIALGRFKFRVSTCLSHVSSQSTRRLSHSYTYEDLR